MKKITAIHILANAILQSNWTFKRVTYAAVGWSWQTFRWSCRTPCCLACSLTSCVYRAENMPGVTHIAAWRFRGKSFRVVKYTILEREKRSFQPIQLYGVQNKHCRCYFTPKIKKFNLRVKVEILQFWFENTMTSFCGDSAFRYIRHIAIGRGSEEPRRV